MIKSVVELATVAWVIGASVITGLRVLSRLKGDAQGGEAKQIAAKFMDHGPRTTDLSVKV